MSYLNHIAIKFVQQKLSKRYKSPHDNLAQSILDCFSASIFFLASSVIVLSQDWAWPSVRWWQSSEADGHQSWTPLRVLFLCYASRELFFLLELKGEEPEHQMHQRLQQCYHLLRALLTLAAFRLRWHRIGGITLTLLDAADPLFTVAKLFKFFGYTRLADVSTATFVVIFFAMRVLGLGYVVWSAAAENLYGLSMDTIHVFHANDRKIQNWIWLAQFGSLFALLAFQLVYGALIASRLIVVCRQGRAECYAHSDQFGLSKLNSPLGHATSTHAHLRLYHVNPSPRSTTSPKASVEFKDFDPSHHDVPNNPHYDTKTKLIPSISTTTSSPPHPHPTSFGGTENVPKPNYKTQDSENHACGCSRRKARNYAF